MSFGSECQWAAELVREIAAAGHDVIALAGKSTVASHASLTVRPLWTRNSPALLRHRLEFLARYTAAGIGPVRRGSIDVLHHMLPFALGWTFNPLALCAPSSLPFVVGPVQTLHGGDLTDEGPESRIFETSPSGLRSLTQLRPLFERLSYRTLARADVVIAVSRAAQEMCLAAVPSANVKVVPPGVDARLFTPPIGRSCRHANEILTVGHLVKRKNTYLLIRAVAQLLKEGSTLTLRIIGDGPERSRLETLARNLGISRQVIFQGLVPNSELPAYYQQAAVVCLVSRAEAAAAAPLEGMACGTPVVCTPTGIMGEILQEREIGILVDGNAASIAGALRTLLADEQLRSRMGVEGRTVIERQHTWGRIGASYVDAYYEACDLRPSHSKP
ncbi:MAG TPA: glycosyltransferase family 4 protein [Acidimicrobiales bacterium]|nr:glycosyltransferase family 4 protein [Acidimicrobiales bacterium]